MGVSGSKKGCQYSETVAGESQESPAAYFYLKTKLNAERHIKQFLLFFLEIKKGKKVKSTSMTYWDLQILDYFNF